MIRLPLEGTTREVVDLFTMAEPPSHYCTDVRAGRVVYDLTNCGLVLDRGRRRVYWDGKPFVLFGGGKVYLEGDVLLWFEAKHTVTWRVADMPERSQVPSGYVLGDTIAAGDVLDVYLWPLGNVTTASAEGENWTDCLVVFVEAIRVGGAHNSKRVRYDGRFYVMHKKTKRYIVGELALEVLETATHVYGVDKENDRERNKELKGY